MVPIAVLWWFSEPILAAAVGPGRTTALAAMYMRILIAGMPGVSAFESAKRFVQSQGLFHATTYTLLVGAPLSFLQNWLFVFKLGWGFNGAAIAMAVTHNLLPLLLILYVRLFEGYECWKGFSRKAFSNWGEFFVILREGIVADQIRPDDQTGSTRNDHDRGSILCLGDPHHRCWQIWNRAACCTGCSRYSYLDVVQHSFPIGYRNIDSSGQSHRRKLEQGCASYCESGAYFLSDFYCPILTL
jgi:hypothetical protein